MLGRDVWETDGMQPVWPHALRAGDRVALVSPASKPDEERLAKGIGLLETWGLVVEDLSPEPADWRAGSDADRQAHLQRALDDEAFRAVICTRGGFGAARIVDGLSFHRFIERAAAFVGFSDATTLHTVLNAHGLITLYGPAIAWDPTNGASSPESISAESLRSALFDRPPQPVSSESKESTHVLSDGETAIGRLVGGNLATLAAGVGTPSQLRAEGAIVLLEEIQEPHPTIDRLLTQLIRSGSLDGAVGFVVGQLVDTYDLEPTIALIREHLAQFDVPILGGIPVGHGECQRTVALGAVVQIDPAEAALQYVDRSER